MKSILLSIKRKYNLKIESKEKTLELRTRCPKGFVGWVFIYETLGKQRYVSEETWENKYPLWFGIEIFKNGKRLITEGRGAITSRFWFDEYDFIEFAPLYGYYSDIDDYRYAVNGNELKDLCLSYNDLHNYGKGKNLYAWQIKKLEVFDEPMELNEFYKATFYDMPFKLSQLKKGEYINKEKWLDMATVTEAPQSYQFVYVKEKENE